MPVTVNPIRNDAPERNLELLKTALGLATEVYKVGVDKDQFEAAQKLTQKKEDDAKLSEANKLAWQSQENDKDRQSKAEIERERIAAQKDLKAKELALKLPGAGGALGIPGKATPGQKTLDTAFAKDFNEWETTGKNALAKNLSLLNNAVEVLEKRKDDIIGTSGRFTGNLPDFLRSEESIALREDVHRAAQGALKAALGTNFTEKEGERIMKAAYNETLSPEENIKRITSAINEIVANAQTMEDRARYFEQNGTLAGFQSSGLNVADQKKQGNEVVTLPGGAQVSRQQILDELAKRQRGTVSK